MILTHLLPAQPDRKWKLARQAGIKYAITKAAPELTDLLPPWDLNALRIVRDRFSENGLSLYGLEGDQMDMQRIKLGLPGRDEDIEKYCRMLHNMGELGIRLLCYNFMAGIGWYRTAVNLPERGGALTSGFDYTATQSAPLTEYGEVSEETIWQNYTYYIQAVLPAAEEAGVQMGLHPDDPPISPLRGIGRILTSAAAYERALAIHPSSFHGITFCQANFAAMGEDVDELIRRWAKKIMFVHFRDIRGTAANFVETFHDDGPTDMPRRMQLYAEVGFEGPIRPDHAPTMEGEENLAPGYEILGQLYAIAYMKGILHTLKIPME